MPTQKSRIKTPSEVNLLVHRNVEQGGHKKTKCIKLKAPEKCSSSGLNHVHRCRVVVKKCERSLFVGLDIKFSNKLHPLDGRKGLGMIHKINPSSPSALSTLEIGDRVLKILGVVIHTKADLMEVINEKKKNISKSLFPKKYYNITLLIEKPCADAKHHARALALKYIEEKKKDVADMSAFAYHCEHCKDTVKFFVYTKKTKKTKMEKPVTSSLVVLNRHYGVSVSSSGGGSKSKITMPKYPSKDQQIDSFQDLLKFEKRSSNKVRVYNKNCGPILGHYNILL